MDSDALFAMQVCFFKRVFPDFLSDARAAILVHSDSGVSGVWVSSGPVLQICFTAQSITRRHAKPVLLSSPYSHGRLLEEIRSLETR